MKKAKSSRDVISAGAARPSTRASVLIVDDHPLVRDGLVRLLSQQNDLICCGEAGTVAETHAAVARHKPDLVILDLRLRNADGLELIKSLKAQLPGLRILVLSQYESRPYVERAMRAGAQGYLVKEQAAEEILIAIRTVLGGEVYLSRGMAAVFLTQLVGTPPKAAGVGIEHLTDRELHVFQLLGAGLSTRAIAGELHVSFKTIETHRENIKHKLGLNSAAELIHCASDWSVEQAPFSGNGDFQNKSSVMSPVVA